MDELIKSWEIFRDKMISALTGKGCEAMSKVEKVIDDLEIAKHVLCNPQMLTREMSVRIGQAITSAVDLLKEREPKQVVDVVEFAEGMKVGRCPSCARSFVNLDADETKFCKSCGQAVKWNDRQVLDRILQWITNWYVGCIFSMCHY